MSDTVEDNLPIRPELAAPERAIAAGPAIGRIGMGTGEMALPEGEPLPSYADIEATLEALDKQAQANWTASHDLYEASSDEVQEHIDAFLDEFGAASQKAEDDGETQPRASSFAEQFNKLPEAFKTLVLADEENSLQIDAAEAALEAYVPQKTAEVLQKATDIETRLDYDKVVAMAFDDNAPSAGQLKSPPYNIVYDVSRVIGARMLIEGGAKLSFSDLNEIDKALMTAEDTYDKQGLFKEPGDNAQPEDGTPLTDDQLLSIIERVGDAYDTHAKYKDPDSALLDTVQNVLRMAGRMRTSGEAPVTPYHLYTSLVVIRSQALGVAMDRKLRGELYKLPAFDFAPDSDVHAVIVEQLKSFDSQEAINGLKIEGFPEDLPFKLSEAEFKDVIMQYVPPAAIAFLKRVQFRSLNPDEDKKGLTQAHHRYSEELGGNEIVISIDKIHENYQFYLDAWHDDPDAAILAGLAAKKSLFNTTIHEFAHELHAILPVAVLQRWEQLRQSDPTNVTDYVKRGHDGRHMHRYMEDFAETMAMFCTKPEALSIVSPVRFGAMRQIFEDFMPGYAETTKKRQDATILDDATRRKLNGISDQEVKSLYLSHEAATAEGNS